MRDLTIIRKRYIPNEEIDISSDRILVDTKDILITKWLPINPRKDIAWGISYVNFNDNYKISRFYGKNDEFLFWYCDIIEAAKEQSGEQRRYVFTDLLLDVVIYPNMHYEIKDMEELSEAFETGLIDKRQYDVSLGALERLLKNIQSGEFPPKDFKYEDFEKGHVDLHIHSCYSDGTCTPSEIVLMAKEAGLSAIALTDHDCIDGIEEAEREAKRLGIEFIQGVELSCRNIHILAYFPNGGIERLSEWFEIYRRLRQERAVKIAEKFISLGIAITYNEVVEEAGGERFIGRIHFARILTKKGYTSSVKEAMSGWLAPGRKGYVDMGGYSVDEIIHFVNESGGVTVLAHPQKINVGKSRQIKLISDLKNAGLSGIEAFYSDNSFSETKNYLALARKKELIVIGGSDFHGDNRPGVVLGKGRGDLAVPYECVSDLRKCREV